MRRANNFFTAGIASFLIATNAGAACAPVYLTFDTGHMGKRLTRCARDQAAAVPFFLFTIPFGVFDPIEHIIRRGAEGHQNHSDQL